MSIGFVKWGATAIKTTDDKYSISFVKVNGVELYEVYQLPAKQLERFDDREKAMNLVRGFYG